MFVTCSEQTHKLTLGSTIDNIPINLSRVVALSRCNSRSGSENFFCIIFHITADLEFQWRYKSENTCNIDYYRLLRSQ